MKITRRVPYGVATALRLGSLRDPVTGQAMTPTFAAGDAMITQDDGGGTDQADNIPTLDGTDVLWTISAAEATAPSANGGYRTLALYDQTNPKAWIDLDIDIITTDHQSAVEPNGVIRQVTPDATPGATSFGVTDAALPTTALGAKFKASVALIVASDVTDDVNCCALVTGYSKAGNVGAFTYAGGWNRTPTGTAANIRVNFYAAGVGQTEALNAVALAAINAEADTALSDAGITTDGITKIAGHTLADSGTGGQGIGAA